MNSNQPAPEQVYDSEVTDSAGNKIGTVDGVWVDDATGALEFVGVKTGWVAGKTHIIPTSDAQFQGRSIQVPYDQQRIKDAPSFGTNDEFSPDDEDTIYRHYGLNRSTAPSPSGLPSGGESSMGTDTGETVGRGYGTGEREYGTRYADGAGDRSAVDQGQVDVPLAQEELHVGKREVEAGRVRIRKVVRTEHQEVPVELRREDVQIERVGASGGEVPGDAFQERQIDVPLMREEAVVEKTAHVSEQVHVGKTVDTEQRTIGEDVRREDVETDQGGTGFTRDDGVNRR